MRGRGSREPPERRPFVNGGTERAIPFGMEWFVRVSIPFVNGFPTLTIRILFMNSALFKRILGRTVSDTTLF